MRRKLEEDILTYIIVALNKGYIEAKKQEAKEQLEKYIKDHNVLYDSDKILKKVIVITLAIKHVLYEFVDC